MHKRKLQVAESIVPVVHPGERLRAELNLYHVTQQEFAATLGISYQRLNGILNGLRSITPDTALLLSKVFSTTAATWLQYQMEYDLAQALAHIKPDPALDKRIADLKTKLAKSSRYFGKLISA